MKPLSDDINERARKIQSIILQRLAAKTQTAIALELGVSEAKISRFKTDDLSEFSKILSILELKIVPDDSVDVSQDEIDALKTFARKYLEADEIRRKKSH